MKNMLNSFGLIALLTLCVVNASAQIGSKTFTKAFNLSGINHIQLDLPGNVEFRTWDNETIRFEITVQLPSGSNPSMVNELASVGRYNLALTTIGASTSIEAPNLKRQIKVGGQEVKENITFLVHVPKNVTIDRVDTHIVAEVKK
jgi:hypothetical protein